MKDKIWMMSIKIKAVLNREEGQDLIEYALIVALIAFAATVGMGSLASGINQAFSNIGSKVASYTS
jgi:pilus assembly protein Flp/PilA